MRMSTDLALMPFGILLSVATIFSSSLFFGLYDSRLTPAHPDAARASQRVATTNRSFTSPSLSGTRIGADHADPAAPTISGFHDEPDDAARASLEVFHQFGIPAGFARGHQWQRLVGRGNRRPIEP